MKKTICLGVAVVAFGLGACERHEWEETKQLYEGHGEHAGGEADGEGAHGGAEEKKDH